MAINRLLSILLIVSFLCVCGCHAQQLVKTVSDLPDLEKKKAKYINQPLSLLLKEIKPAIKTVLGRPTSQTVNEPGALIFHFVDNKEFEKQKQQGNTPISIIVLVKEDFEWDRAGIPADKRGLWTIEDAKKYGNLTVLNIHVFGKVTN